TYDYEMVITGTKMFRPCAGYQEPGYLAAFMLLSAFLFKRVERRMMVWVCLGAVLLSTSRMGILAGLVWCGAEAIAVIVAGIKDRRRWGGPAWIVAALMVVGIPLFATSTQGR